MIPFLPNRPHPAHLQQSSNHIFIPKLTIMFEFRVLPKRDARRIDHDPSRHTEYPEPSQAIFGFTRTSAWIGQVSEGDVC